jgi:hypothetical protein
LGLVANRKIRKGELVFGDSYEFLFQDVLEGDVLRFDRHERASRKSKYQIPPTFPLTRDILTRTHGVPAVKRTEPEGTIIVSWQLEVPGMLINHSCDPNVIDDSHDDARGEAYAARDISKGEELFYDYTFQYYDHGPFFEICLCGSQKCRGKMMGFKALSDEQKKELLPCASDAVKAMHNAEMGTGPPVKLQQYEPRPRLSANSDGTNALPFVVPGPSHANADINIRLDEESGEYCLRASRDFSEGEQVYEFWTQSWPENGTIPIDMVFSRNLLPGDPPESTIVRVYAPECGRKNRYGEYIFSGWDMLTKHSCDPNLVYNDKDEDEDDDWRAAYATRPIHKGEQLSVDMNTILWDRTDWSKVGDGRCRCGAPTCRGTVKGFKYLSFADQEALKMMDWRRNFPPHDMAGKKRFTPGEALVPHVRVSWREHNELAPDSASSDSSSSEESSDKD